MESYDNNPEYHDVFASSMKLVMTALLQNDNKEAKELLRFNIRYAFVLYREEEDSEAKVKDILKEFKELKVGSMELEELIITMTYYQAKAGMKPVLVSKPSDSVFDKFSKRRF